MKLKTFLHCAALCLLPTAAGFAAEPQKEDLRLVGMMASSSRFVLFVTLDGGKPKQLDAIGASIGLFKLVAVDHAKGYADFTKHDDIRRVYLPEGHVRTGSATVLQIPPLESIKGLVGLEERIAARGSKEKVEKHIIDSINRSISDPNLSWEERSNRLADLISGKRRNILVPPGGVDAAFAKKYGLTRQEVENANWGAEVGREFAKGRKGSGK